MGGGVSPLVGVSGVRVQSSIPLDETGTAAGTSNGDTARSWYANVFNIGAARVYKVVALCSASSDATVEETTFTAAGRAEGQAVATCPSGRRVVGGGVGPIAAPVNNEVRSSIPLDEDGNGGRDQRR